MASKGELRVIVEEFQGLVAPILADIRLTGSVSDLRSPAPPTASDPTPPPLNWVDLVMAGGGLLGIAHVGYIVALESVGIRFRAMAGSSAGAIVAAVLAGVRRTPDARAGPDLTRILLAMPIASFKDGQPAESALMDIVTGVATGGHVPWSAWVRLPQFLHALVQINKLRGVHSGKVFQNWLQAILESYGASTLGQLKKKCDLSGIAFEAFSDGKGARPKPEGLAIAVAADVTTATKISFSWERPGNRSSPPLTHSELYWEHADDARVSTCVRASMSIPIFFQPLMLPEDPAQRLPNAGALGSELNGSKWVDVGFDAPIPERVCFQDGGLLSVFPVNLFHVPPQQPVRCPTFGVGLGPGRREQATSNLAELLGADLGTATNIQDYEFTSQNRDYKLLSQVVNTGNVSPLEFDLPFIGKYTLFHNGVVAARDFLMGGPDGRPGFNWQHYKDIRASIARESQEWDENHPTA